MLRSNPWREMCEFVIAESLRSLQEIYGQWNAVFQAWLNNLLNSPIPDDWQDDVTRFVAQTESLGLEISPDSIRTIEAIIESRIASSGRFATDGLSATVSTKTDGPSQVVGVAPQAGGSPAPGPRP
jgi:hypothetical protein